MEYVVKTGKIEDADYTPYGNVRGFFHCRDAEVAVSGPTETGKTRGILEWLHVLACKYPGASLVIARKQLTDVYSTVLRTFITHVLQDDYRTVVHPFGGEKVEFFKYPNESRIYVAGLDKPGKVLSSEHDVIFINQGEQASLIDWEYLITRTTGRAGNLPYGMCVLDCNPASNTHWILRRVADGKMRMFETDRTDNPMLYDQATMELTEQGKRTEAQLRNLTGSRKQRLFHGLWAPAEGAIFEIYDKDKHICEAFEIPYHWPRFVGIDPVGAYVAAIWVAIDPENLQVHAYREYYGPFGITTPEHVQAILTAGKGENIFAYVGGGPSERQARADFTGAGIALLDPPVSDVWSGLDRITQLLRSFNLIVHDSCLNLTSELGDYRRKLKDGEPTEAIHNKEAYHAVDALRYIVAWLTTPTERSRIVYRPIQIGEPY